MEHNNGMGCIVLAVAVGLAAFFVYPMIHQSGGFDLVSAGISFLVGLVVATVIIGALAPRPEGYFQPNPNNPGNLSNAEWDDVGWCLFEDDMGDGPGMMR